MIIASCSSSDLSEKLTLETISTARIVPSFITTMSSRISAISRKRWVEAAGFVPASFLLCICCSFAILLFGAIDAAGVHDERQVGQARRGRRFLPDLRRDGRRRLDLVEGD